MLQLQLKINAWFIAFVSLFDTEKWLPLALYHPFCHECAKFSDFCIGSITTIKLNDKSLMILWPTKIGLNLNLLHSKSYSCAPIACLASWAGWPKMWKFMVFQRPMQPNHPFQIVFFKNGFLIINFSDNFPWTKLHTRWDEVSFSGKWFACKRETCKFCFRKDFCKYILRSKSMLPTTTAKV